ncbi:type VII secretion protein EccE [Carbonactinospora thermoautotrophica]|nr:type VII secretion protein EccE [Carbonactinospora thermoautotrophica]
MANLVTRTGESAAERTVVTPRGRAAKRSGKQTQEQQNQQVPQVVFPRPFPRPGKPIGAVTQLVVLLELAVALILLTPKIWALAITVPIALFLIVLALGRRRERWLAEWMWILFAYRGRHKYAKETFEYADPNLTPVLESRSGLKTFTITDRSRETVGMVGDANSLSAIILVEQPSDGPLRKPRAQQTLPLGIVVNALQTDDVVLASGQIVQHTQPAPASGPGSSSVAARSYATVSGDVPAIRLTWVALRLEPDLCPTAVEARGGGMLGAQRALLKAVRRVIRDLKDAGFQATALNETDLVGALGISCSVNPMIGTTNQRLSAGLRRTKELWSAWQCDGRWHATYWLNKWPGITPTNAPLLPALLTSVPALAVTFSVTVTRTMSDLIGITSHVRVAAHTERELAAATTALEQRAQKAGIGLQRLDGEQLPGLLATLPLGGAVR